MATISLDFRQLTAFRNNGNGYLSRVEGFTVLVYAISKKVMPQVDRAIAKMEESARVEMEKKQFELAEKDPKTQVLLKNEDGSYKYSLENSIELAEENSRLRFPQGHEEIEAYIPKFDHKVLTTFELMAFEGIVIPPIEEIYADELKDSGITEQATNI